MAEKEEDRISRLPDDILSHILSFLELEDAVKTSILSKRWEKVWTWIHRISLNNLSCIRGPNFGEFFSFEEQVKRRISFNNSITGILCGKNNNRILSVTSFRLLFTYDLIYDYEEDDESPDDESPVIINWIAAAISPNLENFYLALQRHPDQISFKMPRTLFECQKLVTLNLSFSDNNLIYLDVPETVCLPNLEMLHLALVKFKDENTLKNLLFGCPVLEELYLKKIYDGHGRAKQNVFVFSPSLKILRVDNTEDPFNDDVLIPFCSYYVVEAPKLENLNFVDRSFSGITMTASPCLVSAEILISACVDYDPKPLSVSRFLQGISNVQNLELGTGQTMMLKDELANLSELHNLIHLRIRWCQNKDIIPCILQQSPHLKHLIFSDDFFSFHTFMWSPPKWVPECLTSHLEIIEIEFWISSNEDEALKLIEYFFDNGKVLKKMVVTSFANDQFLDKVKELTRGDARLCFFKRETIS